MLGRPDAVRDWLMTAALAQSDDAVRAWRQWSGRPAAASLTAIEARWLPLVAGNLARLGAPEATDDVLRRARREAWASNQLILDRARPALTALHRAGIRTVLLKGAALALAVYPDRGARPFGDVDALVEPALISPARAILAGLEWTCPHTAGALPQTARHSFGYSAADGGALDVHQYLLQECTWPGVDAEVWRRTVSVEDEQTRWLVLSPADQLLHVCIHGLRWSRVHAGTWVADAVEVLRRAGNTLAWDVLVAEARQRQLSYQLRVALRLVADMPDVAVPATVLTELGRSPGSWADRLECRVKTRPVGPAVNLWLFWRGWRRARRRHPGTTGFLRFTAGLVGLDARRQLVPWLMRRVRHRW